MMKRRDEWFLTLPSMLLLLLLFVVPSVILLLLAFKPASIWGGAASGWTLQTLQQALSLNYAKVFIRTFWMSLIATLFSLALSVPTAYFIARKPPALRRTLLLLIILPFWSSFLIRIFAWKSLLHPEGTIKKILVFLHLVSPEQTLLFHTSTVLIVMVYAYLPFGILPIFAEASKFDWNLLEAAKDLGATRFQAFRRVFLPNIRSSLITAFMMVFIPSMGSYVIPDMVGGVNQEFIGNKIVQKTLVDRNLPLASALSFLLALSVFLSLSLLHFVTKKEWLPPKRNVE